MPSRERATVFPGLAGRWPRRAGWVLVGLAGLSCVSPAGERKARPAPAAPVRSDGVAEAPAPVLDPRREWLLLPAGPAGDLASSVHLVRVADSAARPLIGLPASPRLAHFAFSPDAAWLAFTHQAEAGTELWLAELATGEARRLSERALVLGAGTAPQWSPDGGSILAALRPDGLGAAPPALQTQLARLRLDGRVAPLGKPGVLSRFEPSPDGGFLLVEKLGEPIASDPEAGRSAHLIEVWDRLGNLVRLLGVRRLGLSRLGARSFTWRADEPATVAFVQPANGDALYLLAAPFGGEALQLAAFKGRVERIDWASGDLALATEQEAGTGRERVWRLRPDRPTLPPELLLERSLDDPRRPGSPLTRPDTRGRPLLETAGGAAVFLVEEGLAGGCPFLDRLDLATRERQRQLSSAAPPCEQPIAFLDAAGRSLLVRREGSPGARYFVHDVETGETRPLRF